MSRPANPLRPVLHGHIMAGGAPKEFAYSYAMSVANVGKMLNALGLRKYFLTREEYDRVMAGRRAQPGRSVT